MALCTHIKCGSFFFFSCVFVEVGALLSPVLSSGQDPAISNGILCSPGGFALLDCDCYYLNTRACPEKSQWECVLQCSFLERKAQRGTSPDGCVLVHELRLINGGFQKNYRTSHLCCSGPASTPLWYRNEKGSSGYSN